MWGRQAQLKRVQCSWLFTVEESHLQRTGSGDELYISAARVCIIGPVFGADMLGFAW